MPCLAVVMGMGELMHGAQMHRLEPLEPRRLLNGYYVSASTGDDTAPGTADAPWRTLQRAANAVRPGDVVNVLAGRYAGFYLTTSGTATKRITFRCEPGVVIDQRNYKSADGINLERASYVTVRGFNVVGMPRAGIRSVSNTNVQIIGNTLDKNVLWGIVTGFSEDVLIEGNIARRSVREHGIYVANSADNPVIRGNVVWGNHSSGIQINSDANAGGDGIIRNALVENNTVHGNGVTGSAINLDGVQNSIVRNNLLYDNRASGISLYRIDGAQGAKDNLIVNNTVVMANDELNPGRFAINIQDASTGNIVRNNILLAWFPREGLAGSVCVSDSSLPGFVSDHNVTSGKHAFMREDTPMDFEEWRAGTKQDANSRTATPAEVFSDVALHDYHLRSDSKALDAGGDIDAPTSDISGDPRPSGTANDPGAFEFQRYVAPGPVTAQAGSAKSIDLSWTDNTAGVTNSAIYRRRGTDGAYVKVKSLGPGRTSYRDTDVEPGTKYYYRVISYGVAGRSDYSAAVGATTPLVAPDARGRRASLPAGHGLDDETKQSLGLD